jgi:hypothetical protein
MRTRAETLLMVAVLVGAAPARAQDAASDPRWLAYIGCWEPVESVKPHLCVVPAGVAAVDLVTIVKGHVTARERIAATGERVETRGGDCTGWRSAVWSTHGQRLYLRSEDVCPGGGARAGTGLIAMTGDGQWLFIQSATVGGQTGLRVERYRGVSGEIALPSDVEDVLRVDAAVTREARAAAAAELAITDVVEASQSLETAVVEAWLIERVEPFTLDAKRLIVLADARVPPQVIDLMIALSYPKVFAINAASRRGERRVPTVEASRGGTDVAGMIAPIGTRCRPSYLMYPYAPAYSYAPFDCGFGGDYRYGFYPGGYPVTIVAVRSGGVSPRPHGRVVNGRGYQQGEGSTGTVAAPRTFAPGGPPSSGSSGSAATSSSGSGEQRTARPRP